MHGLQRWTDVDCVGRVHIKLSNVLKHCQEVMPGSTGSNARKHCHQYFICLSLGNQQVAGNIAAGGFEINIPVQHPARHH